MTQIINPELLPFVAKAARHHNEALQSDDVPRCFQAAATFMIISQLIAPNGATIIDDSIYWRTLAIQQYELATEVDCPWRSDPALSWRNLGRLVNGFVLLRADDTISNVEFARALLAGDSQVIDWGHHLVDA